MPDLDTTTGLEYRVQTIRNLTDDTYVLRIDRHELDFRAGQCVSLGLKGTGINREYSTYSGEKDPHLELLIRKVENGLVSAALQSCRVGEAVSFMGAYGSFVLEKPEDSEQKYLFIATGTGIAPFHSYVQSFPQIDYTLLHGIRYLSERYDMQDYEPSRYVACVSREEGANFRGRVTDYLQGHPAEPDTLCYLCGNSLMLAEAFDLLREQCVLGDNLFTEAFF